MEQFRFRALISGLFVVMVVFSTKLFAASYVVTADLTRIKCANGNQVYMEPLQVLQLADEIRPGTYRVRLPSKYSQRCPVGQVSSYSVYKIGELGAGAAGSSSLSQRRSGQQKDSLEPKSSNDHLSSGNSVLGDSRDANEFFKKIIKKLPSEKMALQCRRNFLGEDDFGHWGDYAKDVMSRGVIEDTLERNKSAFASVCPAYPHMTVEQKKNLLILSMMAKFHSESRCDQNRPNFKCPNGVCWGVAQLHLGHENDDAYVKLKQLKRFCPKNASKSVAGSIECSIAMYIDDLQQGQTIADNPSSYWITNRPGTIYASQYKKLFSQIPDCQVVNLAVTAKPVANRRHISEVSKKAVPSRPLRVTTEVSEANRMPIGNI